MHVYQLYISWYTCMCLVCFFFLNTRNKLFKCSVFSIRLQVGHSSNIQDMFYSVLLAGKTSVLRPSLWAPPPARVARRNRKRQPRKRRVHAGRRTRGGGRRRIGKQCRGTIHSSLGASIESPLALTEAELPPVDRFCRVLRGTRTSMSSQ